MGEIGSDEVICDGGRPLWPERWNWLRHGTWHLKVTAIRGADLIDRREYARRRKARKRRMR